MGAGQRIRDLRKRRGWSQAQLAIQARRYAPNATLARETISRIENERRPPDLWVIEACAAALGVSIAELLSDDPAPETRVPAAPELAINEARPAYGYAPEVAALAQRLNALAGAIRARAVEIINALLDLWEPAAEDAETAAEVQQLERLLDSLPAERAAYWEALIQAEAAASDRAAAPAATTDAARAATS